MNWKTGLFTVIAVVIAFAVWELFVKKIVVRNSYEGFDYQPVENEGYLKEIA